MKPKVCFFLCSPFFTFFIKRKNASLLKRLAFFALAAVIGAGRGDNSHFAFIKQACRAYLWGKKGFVRGCFVLVKAKKAVRVHTQKKASPLFGHLLVGVAVCTAVLAGLLCASAALLCRVDIPLEMTVPLGTGALCLSVLAGSTVTSLIHGKNGLLCGLLFGGIAVVFVGLFSATQGQPSFSTFTAIKAGSILLFGGVGGYAGILWRESHKKVS